MNQPKRISELINDFDIYYEMSDSPLVYSTGNHKKQIITEKLQGLNTFELAQVISELRIGGKIAYNRYFKGVNKNSI